MTPRRPPTPSALERRAPTIRYRGMCAACVRTIENEHRKLPSKRRTALWCVSCHAVLQHVDGGWERAPDMPVSHSLLPNDGQSV